MIDMSNLDDLMEHRRQLWRKMRREGRDAVRDDLREVERAIRALDQSDGAPERKRPKKTRRRSTAQTTQAIDPPKRRRRRVSTIVHTDPVADVSVETKKDKTTDTRPKDVVDAERAWKDTMDPRGRSLYGSAYTLLRFNEYKAVELKHRIAELRRQVASDPNAAGITL